jgi:hypothetical protein
MKKNIHSDEIESYRKAFNYRLDEIHNMVNKDKELKDAPVCIRDKILNDYGESLEREFMYNLTDDRLRKILTNFANAVYANVYYTWDENTTDKIVEEYLKGNL